MVHSNSVSRRFVLADGRQAIVAVLAFSGLTLGELKTFDASTAGNALKNAFSAYQQNALPERQSVLDLSPSTQGAVASDILRTARRFVLDEIAWLLG